MRTIALVLALTLAPLAGARAQDSARVVDPGMSKAQVVARLGQPRAERASGRFTYLFFTNGCERTCGMSDLVVLQDGAVVDAVFRKPGRRYSGTSSSPAALPPSLARVVGARGTTLHTPPPADAAPADTTSPAPAAAAAPDSTSPQP